MRSETHATNNPLLSTTAKALGNSSYGFTLYTAENCVETRYVHKEKIQSYICSNRFVSLEPLSDDYFEVTMKKSTIIENLPFQIGYQVYALSKTYMLHFIHEILGNHLADNHYELLSSDTDSVCMVLRVNRLTNVSKQNFKAPGMKRSITILSMIDRLNRCEKQLKAPSF